MSGAAYSQAAPHSAAGLPFLPNWTAEGDQVDAEFGSRAAPAGNVNGDGYDDVIVSAPNYDHGQIDEGMVYLYYGSASCLSATPGWTAEGDASTYRLGISAAGAGDVNGDGYDDLIVGVSNYTNGEDDEGGAFVYYGSATGPSATPDWIAESNQSICGFGARVASAGDVNGDMGSRAQSPRPALEGAEEWQPALFHDFHRLETVQATWEVLLATLGQYHAGRAEERLMAGADFGSLHSSLDDWEPPSISRVDSWPVGSQIHFEVAAADASGLYAVLVTYTAGEGKWHSLRLAPAGSGTWTASTPAGTEIEFFVQAADMAGNVTLRDDQGAYFRPSERLFQIYLPLVVRGE